jgi:3-oxoacyl-[acyl-carrier-protein] synthase-1
MNSLDITITGFGMINAVGVGAEACAAAVRAGINQYTDCPIVRSTGEPYKMASIPDECLPKLNSDDPASKARSHSHSLYARLLQMGKVALTEACEAAQIEAPIPLFLATPEQRCGRPFPALEPILKDLAAEVEFPLDLLTSRVFPLGRAAGINAMEEAVNLLLTTPLESIIVGGVDSFLDVMLLSALDAEDRLTSSTAMRGFVPGEGAAFVVLQKTPEPSLVVSQTTTSEEPGHYYSESICLGDGLSSAINGAVANIPNPVQTVLCSMNGEPEHVKEWGTSQIRNREAFGGDLDMQHPAECYGDLGAATAPTLMALSAIGLAKGYYQSPLLVWCASDREQRGAVIISSNKESTHG